MKQQLQDILNLLFDPTGVFLDKALKHKKKLEEEESFQRQEKTRLDEESDLEVARRVQEALKEKKMRKEDEDEIQELTETIESTVKGRNETLCWILGVATIGFLFAQLVICVWGTLPTWLVAFIRLFSFSMLGFAALNRLNEVKTIDGTSLLEVTSVNLFKSLYYFGFGLSIFTLSLDIPLIQVVTKTCCEIYTKSAQ